MAKKLKISAAHVAYLENGKRSPSASLISADAARSEAKKVERKAIGKKAKTERSQVKAIRKSKSEKLVCRYCGSDDLAPSFASQSPISAFSVEDSKIVGGIAPLARPIQPPNCGEVVAIPQVGGLHQRYKRVCGELLISVENQ